MADRENETGSGFKNRVVKKLYLYISVLMPLFIFSQKDSISSISNQTSYFKAIQQSLNSRKINDSSIVYVPLRYYNSIFKDIYTRDIYKTPLHQININNNLVSKSKESIYAIYLKAIGKEYKDILNDTIIILENEIKYERRNTYSKIGNSTVVYYDSIAVSKNSKEALNGFYKIIPEHQDDYEYLLAYFDAGSPFIIFKNNMFQYFKASKLVKRKFFVTVANEGYPYLYSYAEDYIPISINKWKREIKTWPSENLLVEDTVIHSGKKAFIKGVQNIYYNEYGIYRNKENLLHKRHTYEKGKLKSVNIYIYQYSIIETRITDLTNKNFKTTIEKRDYSGNLYYHSSHLNIKNKGCSQGLLDKYYTGIDEFEQCFVPHGETYEYKGSENRNHFLDSEEVLRYEKGILTYYQLEYINPFVEVSDNLTLKTFGKPIVAGRKEVDDYKKQTSIREYYTKPDNKLFLRVKTTYEYCIGHHLFESFCKNKKNNSNKYKTQIEYFDVNGTLVFKDVFDQSFKGDYNDYLNNKF
ncbi:hypothetical protein [Flavobacterium sp.]|uniref:hypothetical protein n=1 Tax=Flavobacterium sp. TaxID=239 RepID=UPI0025BE2919|nr:hypothetical protein [Flavobacterium sp.]MBA4155592.1 hypothetical protein [Flavobacterium sp.]MDP2159970.1 hypothetical protein [Flavobacterium sp.]